MVRIKGDSSSLIRRKRADRAASRTPIKAADKNPIEIREREKPMASQKGSVLTKDVRRTRTEMGETKRISCPRAWLASCQTVSQKRAAHRRSLGREDVSEFFWDVWSGLGKTGEETPSPVCLDLWKIVKFIRRKNSTYSGWILLI